MFMSYRVEFWWEMCRRMLAGDPMSRLARETGVSVA
jgi:hypothetical protein